MNNEEKLSSDDHSFEDNILLINTLKIHLKELGFQVIENTENNSLVVNHELLVVAEIVHNPNYHQRLLHLWINTSQSDYFPEGIEDNIVGIGDSIEEKINSVLNNYIHTTFLPIANSINESYEPDITMSISAQIYQVEIGEIGKQGNWDKIPEQYIFFELLYNQLAQVISLEKFNWLKVYIARQADGTISGECLLNNQNWEEGMSILIQYANSWGVTHSFQGLKQFIMVKKL
ncbi:DUF6348 family protein [Rhizosphaericola mali]|uniref:Uncharacterized protein n=1 Tax=Rhizosphaericola mali TaxID=2545455 RepID=A0A5P2GA92_9BACT|nr:DUF6348 family protein [Rhizosphaericola mali]QES90103.1 hypothetical protein E0W69_016075 [Rhizosphaericola mali]